ncbi:hypothetical protein [Sutterella sp.]|uniref:hypothetical protein n=1 Tax=Sutterella sp. TaxID=1981025 RepID=UPI0026E03E82|nr:hypothetical protein [Sutterella sp.]MDO5532026.1 hypothetical protein [Sutterella sp.]
MTRPDPSLNVDYAVSPVVTNLSQPVSKVLLVGNSLMFYNCGVSSMLQGFAKAAGRKLEVTMVGIGGAGLYWHDVKSYLRPNGLRSYRITAENKFEFIDYPDGKIFDAVLMVDSTQGPIHPELCALFNEFAEKHCRTIREHGADPLLMVSWGYSDRPGMTRALADSIITTANRCHCPAVPCGIAFERAKRERPELKLIRTDNRHPTVAGSYLEAAVFYASLFGESPAAINFYGRFDDLVVTKEDGDFLKRIAWETVRDFNRWA